ncbi:MAG: aspartate aminotransferase family protein [Lautropia sp.]
MEPRDAHLWLNQHLPGQRLPRAVRGEGTFVVDETGKRYLDGSGGPALFCLGHGHREVIAAIKAQYDAIEFAYTTTFSSEVIDALSTELAEQAGGTLRRVAYVSSGSEAADTAMKAALQYQLALGRPGRTRFIARRQSWHGYTFGALSLSGHPGRRRPYEQALLPVEHVSPANVYRPPAGVPVAALADHLAAELEQTILRLGPERVAAFFMEPVVGATGGAVPAPPGYAQKVREVCSRYGVLLVADEVMCGVGRCGSWRALAYDGVEPDLMYTAKGLAGGYAPLGAVILSEAIYLAIAERFGTLASVHTYSGHTAACAAALAVQRILRRDRLVERCASEGDYLLSQLRSRFAEHPYVGDIRGRGLFAAFELVRDRETKAPFDPSLQLAARFRDQAFANGLICYPSAGTVDGYHGDHVLVSPPYNIARAETDLMIDLLATTLDQVLPR